MSLRISRSVSKNAVNFYIIKDVISNGRRTTKRVEKLGSLSSLMAEHHTDEDGVMAILDRKLAEAREADRLENQPVIIELNQNRLIDHDVPASLDGGYLFLQHIFFDLKLDALCRTISRKHRFKYDFTDILSRLVYMRILHPASKKGTMESCASMIEPPTFELHDIYRALSVLHEHSQDIQAYLYKKSTDIIDRDTGILYYDCTNYFFELEMEDGLRRYGRSKENRPLPIVQMGLFMDGSGLPLAFSIFPGNQNEQNSMTPLERKILRDFGLSKFIVCTDAGLASARNRRFNDLGGRAFITTQSVKQLKKEYMDWALSSEGWKLPGVENLTYRLDDLPGELAARTKDLTFYKESPYVDNKGTKQTLIVTFSFKYREYQRTVRSRQIERALKMIKAGDIPAKKNAHDVRRFIKTVSHTREGEVADEKTLLLDQECIEKEEKFDGFYAVCTNLDDPAEKIVRINHQRWEIEESFRIMKTDFRARPVHLSDEGRIEAHFLTCFIALLIYRILEKKLGERYTISDIISTLRNMKFHHIIGEGYIPLYKRTELTDSLHELFGFRTDYQITTEKSMSRIIRQTKRKK